MTLRCGCYNEADDIVFGLVHECSKDPELRYTRLGMSRLVPSSWFVTPAEDPAERPYETTLSDDAEPGDLG